MKRTASFILILMILSSLLLLASCSGREESTKNPADNNTKSKDDNNSIVDSNDKDQPFDNNETEDSLKYSTGLAYELNDSSTAYIVTGIGNCIDMDVVIPPEYEGKPVTAIGDYAFYPLLTGKIRYINSVSLPETITDIGARAFAYNPLTEIDLPEGLRAIKHGAFFGTMIESVVIPDSVKRIETAAFMSLYLKSIYIGKGLTVGKIGYYAFLSPALEEIDVSNKNKYYTVIDGILYSKANQYGDNDMVLEVYPSAKLETSFTITENCTLANGCFTFANNLNELHISSLEKNAYGHAFYSVYKLPLFDVADVINGKLNLMDIDMDDQMNVNFSVTDIYLNVTSKEFVSKDRVMYMLPSYGDLRYNGYTYHFLDGVMTIEEYAASIK